MELLDVLEVVQVLHFKFLSELKHVEINVVEGLYMAIT